MTAPADPRDWSPTDVAAFAESAEPDAVAGVLRSLLDHADAKAVAVIRAFLDARHGSTFLKPVPSQLATRALLSLGPRGVELLGAAIVDPDNNIRYASSVLAALWQVSRGRGLVNVMEPRASGQLLDLPLPEGTQAAADRAVRDVFAEALINPEAFWVTSRFLHETTIRTWVPRDEGGTDADASELMGLFAEASIRLSRSVLEEFEALINEELPEERYQQFLAVHPVLIDPLAAEVVAKQRLGLELATDFAIRSHDGRWTLVEIERPQDGLFTAADDFRERFTHAFGQVLDFQHWVDNNVAYAQRQMSGITAPRGLLVMGLRSRLSVDQRAKLGRFVDNSRRIDVHTYDDLLASANSLYQNLRHLPR